MQSPPDCRTAPANDQQSPQPPSRTQSFSQSFFRVFARSLFLFASLSLCPAVPCGWNFAKTGSYMTHLGSVGCVSCVCHIVILQARIEECHERLFQHFGGAELLFLGLARATPRRLCSSCVRTWMEQAAPAAQLGLRNVESCISASVVQCMQCCAGRTYLVREVSCPRNGAHQG